MVAAGGLDGVGAPPEGSPTTTPASTVIRSTARRMSPRTAKGQAGKCDNGTAISMAPELGGKRDGAGTSEAPGASAVACSAIPVVRDTLVMFGWTITGQASTVAATRAEQRVECLLDTAPTCFMTMA